MKSKLRIYFGIFLTAFSIEITLAENGKTIEYLKKTVEVAQEAKESVRVAVPPGAVMAFNLVTCPTGWKPYKDLQGRTIVGAGRGFASNNKLLKERKLNEDGGTETTVLTVAEIPKHTHKFTSISMPLGGWDQGYAKKGRNGVGATSDWGKFKVSGITDGAGESKAHNNMPPFHVLTFCERI